MYNMKHFLLKALYQFVVSLLSPIRSFEPYHLHLSKILGPSDTGNDHQTSGTDCYLAIRLVRRWAKRTCASELRFVRPSRVDEVTKSDGNGTEIWFVW